MTAVPVLAFHAVEDGPGPLCITPRDFTAMVQALHDAGATAVTSSAVASALHGGPALPPRPVAFTFDDGYASVHANALPVLDRLGWPATLFPVTSALGGRNSWDRGAASELRILDEVALREVATAGWELGGHTHTHPDLRTCDDARMDADLQAADERLAAVTGSAPTSFAYPYGLSNARVRAVAARRYPACWCIGAAKTRPGSPVDALPRIEAWYLRNPAVMRRIFTPAGDSWLAARRALREVRARAANRKDAKRS